MAFKSLCNACLCLFRIFVAMRPPGIVLCDDDLILWILEWWQNIQVRVENFSENNLETTIYFLHKVLEPPKLSWTNQIFQEILWDNKTIRRGKSNFSGQERSTTKVQTNLVTRLVTLFLPKKDISSFLTKARFYFMLTLAPILIQR